MSMMNKPHTESSNTNVHFVLRPVFTQLPVASTLAAYHFNSWVKGIPNISLYNVIRGQVDGINERSTEVNILA
jgi:hypothetical protein